MAAVLFRSSTYLEELKKIKAGYLIKEMLDRFDKKINNDLKPDRSLWIFSVHDATIVNVLNALDVYDVSFLVENYKYKKIK